LSVIATDDRGYRAGSERGLIDLNGD